MAPTTHLPFANTLEKTHAWIAELQDILGSEDPHQAYMTLRATLHALRDRLSPEETADLAAQLPMLVRGFFYEGWRPAHKPLRYRHRGEFLQRVMKEAPWLTEEQAESAVTAVFEVLSSQLGRDGEIQQVRSSLPAELRELWPLPGM
jgi:uncharacterized protein (DUF2267 family)